MKGRSILITGVTGKSVLPVAAALAANNEVFGQSRFALPGEEETIAGFGIKPCKADFALGDFEQLPRNVDYVLHFAWMRGAADELEAAMKVNVEGAGLLFQHCRSARAALVVSSSAVYRGQPDPLHSYREGDPVGAGPSVAAETSPVCKIGLEAVARLAARSLGLPMTIARLNTVLGPHRAYYGKQLEAIREGREIVLPSEGNAHNPIHSEDMIDQIEALLDAASSDPLTVNWSGDEIAISQNVIAQIAQRAGREARVVVQSSPGMAGGCVTDTARRLSITGSCRVRFADGLERMLDEMLDGKPARLAQRDWDYASKVQNRIVRRDEGPSP